MRNKNRYLRLTALALLGIFFYASCKQPARKEEKTAGSASPDSASAKTVITYAHGFSIEYHDHFKLAKVFERLTSGTDTLQYLLVPEGYPVPAGYPGAQVIHTPVKTIIGMSSMHIALAGFAEITDRIIGMGSLNYISSPEVLKNVKAGKIIQVGLDGNINNELIISMHPGLLIAMGNPDAGFSKYKTLTDAGVPVLLNNEWLETTPLGRAEWVKLIGALVDKEELVNKKFDSVARTYNELAQLSSKTTDRPRVIIAMPYKGTWYTPAGESYMGQFLKDAGAGYKWAGSKGTGSLALSFETVAPEALGADYWLNVGYVDSKKDIADKDPRYTAFGPFQKDKVYNFNARTNDQGSNDYWESGGVNPQLVLADMIKILHPGLLPDHQLYYYKQLK